MSDLRPSTGPPAAGGTPLVPPPRRQVLPWVLVVILVVALAGAGTVAVVQSDRLGEARDDVADLREEVAAADARIAELEAEAGEDSASAPSPGDLSEMFGEDGLGGMLGEDGLGGLLGEDGPLGAEGLEGLGSLFEGAAAAPDVQACLADVTDLPNVSADTLQGQIDQTAEVVQQLRGLEFPEPVDPEVQSDEEIREVFAGEIAEAYPADVADQDRRILSALRAVPADLDLVEMQTELLGDQVAGYYDDEDQTLVVRGEDADDPLGGFGLITLAHEMDHALVDAALGLPPLDGYGDDEDGALAALAVVEGGAVALQSQFQVTALDLMSLLGDIGALAGADQGLDEVPAFVVANLTFPYVAGASYVCGLYAEGGWEAVDAAILDPPATSHEVLFPDALDQTATLPELAGPEDFDRITSRTFGAAPLSWLFAAPGDDPDAALEDPVAAVQPWRGGQVTLWTRGEDSAVALALSGAGLCDPLVRWWDAATDGTGAAPDAPPVDDAVPGEVLLDGDDSGWGVVACEGDDVRLGVGPTIELARQAIG